MRRFDRAWWNRLPSRRWDGLWLIAAWAAARVPLIWLRLPPIVEIDSFCYAPFWSMVEDPHYPVLYGVFVHSFSIVPAIVFQHLSVLVSALVLYRVGRSAFSRGAALITGTFISVYPGFAIFAHTFMSETLFIFFIALHLGAFWAAIGSRSPLWCFLAGALAGTACLVRPIALLQPLVAIAVLFPFLGGHNTRRRFLSMAVCLLLGFVIVAAPVAAIVKLHYGRFTLSSGLYPVTRDRLVGNPYMSVGAVGVSDPEMAKIRDYLATEYDKDRDTMDGIRARLDRPGDGNLRLEKLINGLWWRFVATHPLAYTRESMTFLWGALKNTHSLVNYTRDSRMTLKLVAADPASDQHPIWPLTGWRDPEPDRLEKISRLYLNGSKAMVFVPAVLAVLALSAVGAILLRSDAGVFLRYVVLSIVPLFVIPFFLTMEQLRYRYPFDLLFAVLLGAVVWMARFLPSVWISLQSLTASFASRNCRAGSSAGRRTRRSAPAARDAVRAYSRRRASP